VDSKKAAHRPMRRFRIVARNSTLAGEESPLAEFLAKGNEGGRSRFAPVFLSSRS
jgi:hypothetical protein